MHILCQSDLLLLIMLNRNLMLEMSQLGFLHYLFIIDPMNLSSLFSIDQLHNVYFHAFQTGTALCSLILPLNVVKSTEVSG